MGNTRHRNRSLTEEAIKEFHDLLAGYLPPKNVKSSDSPDPKPHSPKPRQIPIRYKDFGQLSWADFEVLSSIPAHPFWSKVEKVVDFSFADTLCAPLYSSRGQRAYAPSLKLKMHLVQRYYGWSDREMESQMIHNLAIKLFLRVPIGFKGLDHSTVGLDRDRLGSVLFDACHHLILAQARAHGLWAAPNERWLMDSFHSHAAVQRRSSYRLIQQSVLRVLQHMKRSYRALFDWLIRQFPEQSWTIRVPKEQAQVAYSRLVAQCYSLMHWLDRGPLHELFWSWPDPEQQLRSLELQARLCEILRQYARPVTPATSETSKKQDDKPSSEPPVAQHTQDASQQGSAQEQVLPTESKQEEARETPSDEIQYEKIPRNERPSDLIVSASDPEVRTGHKTAHKSFLGDKYQVVETADQHIIVDMEPIPGNEHDGERVVEMIDRLTELHQFKPGELVGDTAYGTGSNRRAMESRDIALTAPVRNPISNGFFDNSQFQYDAQNLTMTCPNNQTTSRRARNNVEEGHQFIFDAKMCQACPLLSKCTKAKKRTVFVSDYYEHIQRAMKHNETEAGKQALQARREIERMNNEIKNHIGMKESKEHSREKRRIQAKLTAMVINIRTMVKKLLPPAEPIQRYKKRVASPCA